MGRGLRVRGFVLYGAMAAMLGVVAPVSSAYADVGGEVSGMIVKRGGAWAVIKGSYLKATLEGWCREAGWDLIWDSSSDYQMGASAAFEEDFESAVAHLIDSIYIKNPEVTATLYRGNKVLHIEERSLTSN